MASVYFLSCSALAGITLQLLACLARVQFMAAFKLRATRKIESGVPASLHNLEHFFTLSHTLPLHASHLNIGLLIAKIQANLAQNKANKMVDKIQPYREKTKIENFTSEAHSADEINLFPNQDCDIGSLSYLCALLIYFFPSCFNDNLSDYCILTI